MNPQHTKRFRPRVNNNAPHSAPYPAPRQDRAMVNLQRKVFDSSGPDGRVRGTAAQVYERYLAQARDYNSSGDRVNAENCLQHAEHYLRILNSANPHARPNPHDETYIVSDEDDRFADFRRSNTPVQPHTLDKPEDDDGNDSAATSPANITSFAPNARTAPPAAPPHASPRNQRPTHDARPQRPQQQPQPQHIEPTNAMAAYAAPQPSLLYAAPPIVPVLPPVQAALPAVQIAHDTTPHDDDEHDTDTPDNTSDGRMPPRRRIRRRRIAPSSVLEPVD